LFGGAFGGDDVGWHGFGAGRKIGSEDLQLLLLALLADKPAHGYELIQDIGERSGGFYRPSPGVVYPALTYLEEIGHAEVEVEGARKLYRITDAGRAHLAQNRRLADTIVGQLAWMGEKMEHVRRAFSAAGDEARASHELRDARSRLRAALAERVGAADDEQRRIAEILDRATDAIRGKS